MKTITCDKCGKEVSKHYRSVSATNFVGDIGYTADLVYRPPYPEYDLCEQCNADFNHYISKKIWEFFQPKVSNTNDCTTCKYYDNTGLFPCGGCDTHRKPDGTIIKTQWESNNEN